MAAVKAPQFDSTGKKTKDVTLDEGVFAAEVRPHLVHEAVRSELNAQRAGTSATKSRGLVSGGRQKPWRQKGTGRARQGTIRAPQFEGGGHAFAKVPAHVHPEGEPESGQGRPSVGSGQSRGVRHHRRRCRGCLRRARDQARQELRRSLRPRDAAGDRRDRGRDRASSRASATCSASRSSSRASSTSPRSSGRARCSSPSPHSRQSSGGRSNARQSGRPRPDRQREEL